MPTPCHENPRLIPDRREPGLRARGPRAAGLLLVALLASAPQPVQAAAIEGERFAEKVRAGERVLDLHGLALFRYRVVFRAYVAGLYLEDRADAERVLSDVPKRLELSYFWGIDAKDFGETADQLLAKALAPAALAALRERVDRMHALYRDVKPGDRYSLTYLPGRGTELSLNGKPLGTVEGADFAAAYFGIWLGNAPIDGGFRDELLAGNGTGRP